MSCSASIASITQRPSLTDSPNETRQGAVAVLLDPDVARGFQRVGSPVNAVLRALMTTMRRVARLHHANPLFSSGADAPESDSHPAHDQLGELRIEVLRNKSLACTVASSQACRSSSKRGKEATSISIHQTPRTATRAGGPRLDILVFVATCPPTTLAHVCRPFVFVITQLNRAEVYFQIALIANYIPSR